MKPIELHPGAQAEAKGEFDYLWDRSQPAALGLNEELRRAYRKIGASPLICSPFIHGTRRALLHHYPYSVVFRERLHDIQIIAIAHAKRRPGYWANRLKQ